MIAEQLEEIKNRKNYYRDNFKRLTNFLFFCCFAILILLSAIIYNFFTAPQPFYYATCSNGRLVQLLNVPRGTGLVTHGNV